MPRNKPEDLCLKSLPQKLVIGQLTHKALNMDGALATSSADATRVEVVCSGTQPMTKSKPQQMIHRRFSQMRQRYEIAKLIWGQPQIFLFCVTLWASTGGLVSARAFAVPVPNGVGRKQKRATLASTHWKGCWGLPFSTAKSAIAERGRKKAVTPP
jgi:hypothetical protein